MSGEVTVYVPTVLGVGVATATGFLSLGISAVAVVFAGLAWRRSGEAMNAAMKWEAAVTGVTDPDGLLSVSYTDGPNLAHVEVELLGGVAQLRDPGHLQGLGTVWIIGPMRPGDTPSHAITNLADLTSVELRITAKNRWVSQRSTKLKAAIKRSPWLIVD